MSATEQLPGVITLAEGKLYGLANPIELDGRVASHPLDMRCYTSGNCYLAIEGDRALLVDTGYSSFQDALCEQIASLVSPTTTLSIWALRLGEFASICNVRPIVERFDVDLFYGSQGKPPEWVDFRPEFAPYGTPVAAGALGRVAYRHGRDDDLIAVGSGGRGLLVLDAPLRLLLTNWAYDAETKTLFTSDAFSYAVRPTAEGPWVATLDDDPTTPDQVWDTLLGARFWWLAGARTDPLRASIAAIFDAYEIDAIAPAFGCILQGRGMVERHYKLIDDLLAKAAALEPNGLDVSAWRVAELGGGG